MKQAYLLLLLLTPFTFTSAITLSWFNDFDNSQFVFGLDEVTELPGGGDGSTGEFLQLIKINIGTDVTSIDFSQTDGVHSDHTLLDTTFIDSSTFGPGEFEGISNIIFGTGDTEVTTNDLLFVRAWNAPSPNFSSDLAPIPLNGVSSSYYGNSATYSVTSIENTGTEEFLVQSFSTTTAIPEPTTIAILLMGILGICGFRKHLRKN
jgi:hypothetical protein